MEPLESADKPVNNLETDTQPTPGTPQPAASAGEPSAAEPLPEPKAGETFKPVAATPAAAVNTLPSAPEPTTNDEPEQKPETVELPDQTPPDPLPLSTPKKRGKGLLIGLIAGAAVLLLAGGGAAAMYYVTNKPENILKRALANMLDTSKGKTVTYSGSFSVKELKSNMNIGGTFQGGFESQTGALDLNAKIDAVVANLAFDVRSTDGKTYYFRVGGLDGLTNLISSVSDTASPEEAAMIQLYAPLIDTLNNQWLELNQSLLTQVTGQPAGSVKLSDADRAKLLAAYQQYSFITVKQKLADEAVKGVQSYHFKLGIDKAQLKAFAAALKDAKMDSLKITQEQLNEFNKSVDHATFDTYAPEVWIAKDTKMLNQLRLQASDKDAQMSFTFTIEGFNQPFTVQKPEAAKSVLDVLGGFLTGGGDDSALNQLEDGGISL